jgi:hypothetical protein
MLPPGRKSVDIAITSLSSDDSAPRAALDATVVPLGELAAEPDFDSAVEDLLENVNYARPLQAGQFSSAI